MRGATRRGAVLCGLLLLGCAADLVAQGGGYHDRRRGFTIGSPPAAWRRVDLAGTLLAFERAASASMSLQSICGRPLADPAIMARHLVIGIRQLAVIQSGPIDVAGLSGWTQTFDSVQEGRAVRVKTVTTLVRDCTFDWVLAALAPEFDAAEAVFDAWWASFSPAAASGGGVGR